MQWPSDKHHYKKCQKEEKNTKFLRKKQQHLFIL